MTTLHLTAPGYTLAHLDPHQCAPGMRHLDGDVCGPSHSALVIGATVAYLSDYDAWEALWDDHDDPCQVTALIRLGNRITRSFPTIQADKLTEDEALAWLDALCTEAGIN